MSVLDALIVPAILVVVVIIVVLLNAVTTPLYQAIMEQGSDSPVSADINQSLSTSQESVTGMDAAVSFLLFALIAVSIIGAYIIRSSPIMFAIGIISSIVVLITSGVISNLFIEVAESNATLTASANSFPILAAIFTNLPIISVFWVIAIMVALYAGGGT